MKYIFFNCSTFPYVSVSPLPNDFSQWHGNLRGPEGTLYEGGVFHFAIQFPRTYPRSGVGGCV